MSLKNKAISGVKWTTVSAVAASLMQLIQVAVLTRYLNKADFGLMAMALFVIGISQIFIDMGMSNALIHKQRVNKFQLSTLFWTNILLGITVFSLIFLSSPWIASFYKTPELKGVINWIGVTFLIIPWGQQFEALLMRDLRFKSLAFRDILSKILGFIVAVVLAIKGFGVYALVYANLTGASISTLLLFILGMRDYRPGFVYSFRSLKDKGFFSFGLFQMGEKILNYFTANFDTILIGKLLGMDALGIYNIAKVLAMKPFQILNPIITKVAFPLFSKVQNDISKLKNAYLKIINILTSTNAPIYICMIVLAHPLIILVFGAEWEKAVPIFQFLAISSICISIGNPVGSLQLARGRADLGFYWNVALVIFLPVVMWGGSFYGLIGVAIALAGFKLITIVLPTWYFFIRPLCAAKFGEYFKSYARPVFIAIFAAILPLALVVYVQDNYISLLLGAVVYMGGYTLLTFKMNSAFITELAAFMPATIMAKLKLK